MVHEFAVEPAALQKWESLRYFADRFGVSQGRLIAQYPKLWLRLVREGCAETTPLNRKRFEVVLEKFRSKLIKTNRSFDTGAEWLLNAIQAHNTEPFRAIIASTEGHALPVLCADEIDDSSPLWASPNDGQVHRTASAMASLLESVLRMATTIRFIDQHFSCTSRHCRPLTAMLGHAFSGKTPQLIEYHLNASTPAALFVEGLKKQKNYLNLPPSQSITFVRWKTINGGENLHARYILTNRGGIRIDYGLDEGHAGETTDWNRISESSLKQRCAQFEKGSKCFEFVDGWVVSSQSIIPIREW